MPSEIQRIESIGVGGLQGVGVGVTAGAGETIGVKVNGGVAVGAEVTVPCTLKVRAVLASWPFLSFTVARTMTCSSGVLGAVKKLSGPVVRLSTLQVESLRHIAVQVTCASGGPGCARSDIDCPGATSTLGPGGSMEMESGSEGIEVAAGARHAPSIKELATNTMIH
jgi:hypothetical protein